MHASYLVPHASILHASILHASMPDHDWPRYHPRVMISGPRQLELLRRYRSRRDRDVSISSMVGDIAAHSARTQRRLGELIELWEQLVPPELAPHTSLSGLRGGVLHVIVDSSASHFELDRLLREGLTQDLRRNFRGTLVRIKTRIGRFS